MVDCVFVGADRVAANGDVVNKIGTYALALAADRAGIPFIVVAPESTRDPLLASGDGCTIEQRSPGRSPTTRAGGCPSGHAGAQPSLRHHSRRADYRGRDRGRRPPRWPRLNGYRGRGQHRIVRLTVSVTVAGDDHQAVLCRQRATGSSPVSTRRRWAPYLMPESTDRLMRDHDRAGCRSARGVDEHRLCRLSVSLP